MADLKQKALDYLKSNADTKEVHVTTDGTLFLKLEYAKEHARTLDAEHPKVETFKKEVEATKADEALDREALVKQYTELYGKAPAQNAKDATILEKIEAKKAELANVNADGNIPEGEENTTEKQTED